jgi:hypothetical protein
MKKFAALAFALLGVAGTLLPFATMSITGDQKIASAASKVFNNASSAWKFDGASGGHAGMVLGVILGVAALFGLLVGLTRLARGLAIPMTLVALLGLGLSIAFWNHNMGTRHVFGVDFKMMPGLGGGLMLAALAGLVITGLVGVIKPDRRAA